MNKKKFSCEDITFQSILYGPYVLSGDCYLSDLFAQLTQLMAALPADKIASHSQIGKFLIFVSIFLAKRIEIDTLPTYG